MQGFTRMHVGVDNLNVVRHVSRIINGESAGRPFPLVNDGDLLQRVCQLVRWRDLVTLLFLKLRVMLMRVWLPLGRVREVDRVGHNEADAAAALGRRRVHHSISAAKDVVARSCARWYPVVRDLHRFFIAIARSVVNKMMGVRDFFASGYLV